jgi:hypothetical protein
VSLLIWPRTREEDEEVGDDEKLEALVGLARPHQAHDGVDARQRERLPRVGSKGLGRAQPGTKKSFRGVRFECSQGEGGGSVQSA